MRCFCILPDAYAQISTPFSSCTRKRLSGSASETTPSNSISSSLAKLVPLYAAHGCVNGCNKCDDPPEPRRTPCVVGMQRHRRDHRPAQRAWGVPSCTQRRLRPPMARASFRTFSASEEWVAVAECAPPGSTRGEPRLLDSAARAITGPAASRIRPLFYHGQEPCRFRPCQLPATGPARRRR